MRYDYVIIGAGVIGLAIARELKRRFPAASICVLEKERDVAFHASGRNSGVLHAGFYYTADSLKARFTRDGNRMMKQYCRERQLAVHECGKLVVAADEVQAAGLEQLKRRGDVNGVELHWLDEAQMRDIEPRAVSFGGRALYSPTTASVNPVAVCHALRDELLAAGVAFMFDVKYVRRHGERAMETTAGQVQFDVVVNAAGLYADRIARDFGFGLRYTMMPFKGIYVKYAKNNTDIRTNIYPVPNLRNPFLGVHFTKTADHTIKIGPTAIPAFWRENYRGLDNFSLKELAEVVYYQARLWKHNAFGFRQLALDEIKKYRKAHLVSLALGMVQDVAADGFGGYMKPGIRAQLLDTEKLELVQDFVLEGDGRSMHVLNAVSPAFTCSLPFAAHVVNQLLEQQRN